MMKERKPTSRQPRRRGSSAGHAHAGYDDEEYDEIESLARDAEHIEDEIDPDPARYPTPSEHAQERR